MSNASQNSGDSDDLEALFDSIVMAGTAEPEAVDTPAPAVETVTSSADKSSEDTSCNETVYSQIGHMTRNLHETLRELGYDKSLENAVESMPDARDRLNYIAAMTEQAAERALTATEAAIPIQEKLEADAAALSQQWDRLFAKQLNVEEFKTLVTQTQGYLADVPVRTKATNAQLMEVMMAQDFQDLTGQVIKKIIDVAQSVEQQLVKLLVESTPQSKKAEVKSGLLNGPVINSEGRTDVVTSQTQVDDLLDSLGF
ncbi:protein phosphatase CheZ [Sulfurirhabdus autotrophica]|uniref:Protein phosphatase CheZ n=1 Tax=Sulfurirhabdus autotrophica TaxID=1706046 RepID=A0A4R3YFB1_9PROT|nr:protein phosphatase CheZ [Sulfurirhabdus autotrophica]TCV90790.1 chemotaxis protein CheZ [Sulfurirhabdus autotrophica]